MKVIDLLNTPLDKLPKKIKIEDTIYNLLIDEDNLIYYQNEECKYFMYSISCFNELNEEVELIEEDKEIEEIEFDEIDEMTDYDIYSYPECEDDSKENFKNKINQLIKNQKTLIKLVNKLKKGK